MGSFFMNPEKPLRGRAILVTRPERQAVQFCRLIEAEGGEAVRFPTLEIRAFDPIRSVFSKPDGLNAFDWLIFISANAVYFALKACENASSIPAHVRVAAIGEATASALKQSGIKVDLVPRERFSSEAFLALNEMRSIAGQHVLIVRGRGGRELLADTLQARGAHVRYAEVYERVRPAVDIGPQLPRWRALGIDAITIFSGESLTNFVELLGEEGMAWAKNVPLVVASDRIAERAELEGFKTVIVAAGASDGALFDALTRTLGPRMESGSNEMTID